MVRVSDKEIRKRERASAGQAGSQAGRMARAGAWGANKRSPAWPRRARWNANTWRCPLGSRRRPPCSGQVRRCGRWRLGRSARGRARRSLAKAAGAWQTSAASFARSVTRGRSASGERADRRVGREWQGAAAGPAIRHVAKAAFLFARFLVHPAGWFSDSSALRTLRSPAGRAAAVRVVPVRPLGPFGTGARIVAVAMRKLSPWA